MNILNKKFNFQVLKTTLKTPKPVSFSYGFEYIQEKFDKDFEIKLNDLHVALFGKIKLYLIDDNAMRFANKIYCGTSFKIRFILNELNCPCSSDLPNKNFESNDYKKNFISKDPVNEMWPCWVNQSKTDKIFKKFFENQRIVEVSKRGKILKLVLKLVKSSDIESTDYFDKNEESLGTIELEIKEIPIDKNSNQVEKTLKNKDKKTNTTDKNQECNIPKINLNKQSIQKQPPVLHSDEHISNIQANRIKKEIIKETVEDPLINITNDNDQDNCADNSNSEKKLSNSHKSNEKLEYSNYERISVIFKLILFIKFYLFNKIPSKILNSYVINIIRLQCIIQEGTISCRFKIFIGFIFIQMFSKVILANSSLQLDKLQASKFSKKKILAILRALHYSAAAYSEFPVKIFIPCKIRNVSSLDPNKKHILDRVPVDERDVIKIHDGDVFSVPFCAFFCNSNQLVISFRGSSKPADILKILTATYIPFMNGFAHEGFLSLALNFINTEISELLKKMKKRQSKKVLFTGHSMGGAIGILVCLILSNIKKFNHVVQINSRDMKILNGIDFSATGFSVPPTVSKSISDLYFPNITVFSFEKDIIPKLSFGSILDFKYLCVSVGSRIFNIKNGYINEISEFLIKSNLNEKLFSPGKIYIMKFVKENNSTTCTFSETNASAFSRIELHLDSIYYHTLNCLTNAFMSRFKE